jgi:hypothetical protein
VLKFVCFLFFEYCDVKRQIVPFTKAKICEIRCLRVNAKETVRDVGG